MTAETAIKVLASNSLRWSKPKIFNDPFDTQLPYLIEKNINFPILLVLSLILDKKNYKAADNIKNIISLEQRKNGLRSKYDIIKSFLEDNTELLNASVKSGNDMLDNVQQLFCLCLAEDQLNVAMWAHYTKNHEGIVLGFHTNKSDAFENCYPVSYAGSHLTPQTLNCVYDYEELAKLMVSELCLVKSSDWEKEKEWRCFSDGSPDKDFQLKEFPASTLKSVHFGLRSDAAIKKTVQLLAKNLNSSVDFFQCKTGKGSFKIEEVSIE